MELGDLFGDVRWFDDVRWMEKGGVRGWGESGSQIDMGNFAYTKYLLEK